MTKKKFEVLSIPFNGKEANWDYANIVEAFDHREACELWAEESDNDGDYDIISRGEHGPVLIREKGTELVKTFTIWAYNSAVYNAREN